MFFKGTRRRAGGGAAADAAGDRPAPLPRASGVPSIISADMTIRGDLKSQGDLHVEGTVLGDIDVGQLVVADGATIRGEIVAQGVRICGGVTGLIRARDVVLTATARVIGDIHHEVLSIEAGAQLEGQCRRLGDEKRPTAMGPKLALEPLPVLKRAERLDGPPPITAVPPTGLASG